jgi:hypothetical protein
MTEVVDPTKKKKSNIFGEQAEFSYESGQADLDKYGAGLGAAQTAALDRLKNGASGAYSDEQFQQSVDYYSKPILSAAKKRQDQLSNQMRAQGLFNAGAHTNALLEDFGNTERQISENITVPTMLAQIAAKESTAQANINTAAAVGAQGYTSYLAGRGQAFTEYSQNRQTTLAERTQLVNEAVQRAQQTGKFKDPANPDGPEVSTVEYLAELRAEVDSKYSRAQAQATATGEWVDPVTGESVQTIQAQQLEIQEKANEIAQGNLDVEWFTAKLTERTTRAEQTGIWTDEALIGDMREMLVSPKDGSPGIMTEEEFQALLEELYGPGGAARNGGVAQSPAGETAAPGGLTAEQRTSYGAEFTPAEIERLDAAYKAAGGGTIGQGALETMLSTIRTEKANAGNRGGGTPPAPPVPDPGMTPAQMIVWMGQNPGAPVPGDYQYASGSPADPAADGGTPPSGVPISLNYAEAAAAGVDPGAWSSNFTSSLGTTIADRAAALAILAEAPAEVRTALMAAVDQKWPAAGGGTPPGGGGVTPGPDPNTTGGSPAAAAPQSWEDQLFSGIPTGMTQQALEAYLSTGDGKNLTEPEKTMVRGRYQPAAPVASGGAVAPAYPSAAEAATYANRAGGIPSDAASTQRKTDLVSQARSTGALPSQEAYLDLFRRADGAVDQVALQAFQRELGLAQREYVPPQRRATSAPAGGGAASRLPADFQQQLVAANFSPAEVARVVAAYQTRGSDAAFDEFFRIADTKA